MEILDDSKSNGETTIPDSLSMKYDRQIMGLKKNRQIRNKTEIQPLNKEENWISKSLEREGGETLETKEDEEEEHYQENHNQNQKQSTKQKHSLANLQLLVF